MFVTDTKKQLAHTKGKKFTPRSYQKKSIEFLLKKAEAGLFLAPGLGKTICVLMAFKILLKKKYVRNILIVSKLRIIYDVWPEEIDKWGMSFSTAMLHGSKKDKEFDTEADIYLVNYEGLEWLKSKLKGRDKDKFDWVVYDESSKIKNTKSKRFKIIKKISGLFKRRTILTGSPAPNGLKDIYGQVYALDMGKTFGPYITKFLISYFYPSGYMGYDWKLMPGAEKEIYKKLKPLVLRFGLNEIPDLPKLIINDVYVDLPDKARTVYKDVEKDFIHELESGIITASNSGVKSQKLRQIASGNVYGEEKKTFTIHEAKIEALIDIIEELQGSPCLVAFEFRHELDSILKIYPGTPFICGGVTPKEGTKIKNEWNKGLIPVLLCQYESVAHGLNLQDSGYNIVMYSFTWNLENYEQLILRIRRSGQKSDHVILHRIIARNTIDDKVMLPTIDRKDKTQRSLLKAMENNYMTDKEDSERKFAMTSNEKNIGILKKFVEGKNLQMPVYYWGKKDSDKLFITDLIKRLSPFSEVLVKELITELGKTPKKGGKGPIVKQLKEEIFSMFKVKISGKNLTVKDDLLLKQAAEKIVDTTGEHVKPTEEDSTMGSFKSNSKKTASKKTASKKTASKKTASKKTASKKTANNVRSTINESTKITKGSNVALGGVHAKMLELLPKKNITVKAFIDVCSKKLDHVSSKDRNKLIGYLKFQILNNAVKVV